MKRILLACLLLTATMGVTSVQQASAYSAPAAPVTQASFLAKVNLMDSQIGAGSLTAAEATWNDIHTMMLSVLAVTKNNILTATTPAAEASFRTILANQTNLYQMAWNLKTDLTINRTVIHDKLIEFKATI